MQNMPQKIVVAVALLGSLFSASPAEARLFGPLPDMYRKGMLGDTPKLIERGAFGPIPDFPGRHPSSTLSSRHLGFGF